MTTHALPSVFSGSFNHPMNNVTDTSQANTYFEDFMESSGRLAKEILEPQKFNYTKKNRQMGRVKIKNYNFYSTGPSYGYREPVYVVDGRRHRDDKNPSDNLRAFAGIAGAILGGFAIYKVGQTLNYIRDAGAEVNETKEFQFNVRSWKKQASTGNENLFHSVETIAAKRSAIFSRIKQNAVWNLVIAVSVVVAAVFLLTGSIFASVPAMGVGLVFTLIAGAGLLFKLGYRSSDSRDEKDAQAIRHELIQLKGQSYYDSISTSR